jgi:hypothetical protein
MKFYFPRLEEKVIRSLMISTRKGYILLILFVFALCACTTGNEEIADVNPDEVLTRAAEIAISGLTQTSQAVPSNPPSEPESVPTETITPTLEPVPTTQEIPTNALAGTLTSQPTSEGAETNQPTQSSLPTETQLPAPTNTVPATEKTCLLASLEWENYPDNTRLPYEFSFIKVWRLKNIGSCTWTPGFNLVWVDGELFHAETSVQLTTENIFPSEYVNVSVPMKAPPEPGTYKGLWLLQSASNEYFGVGPLGDGALWLQIIVYDPDE